jgi:Cu(I)/Ag(I) efflux system periplasmic protein CusF
MNRLFTALALAFAGSAFAADLTDGEIRKVDKETAKLTIRHAEIKSLDMPPMTMVFHVKDAKMLDQVKVGDRVRFAAEKLGGNYTVTALEPAAK